MDLEAICCKKTYSLYRQCGPQWSYVSFIFHVKRRMDGLSRGKECKGSRICPHNRFKDRCRECQPNRTGKLQKIGEGEGKEVKEDKLFIYIYIYITQKNIYIYIIYTDNYMHIYNSN